MEKVAMTFTRDEVGILLTAMREIVNNTEYAYMAETPVVRGLLEKVYNACKPVGEQY